MDSYKLTVELIPETAWYSNLRERIGRSAWRKIANEVKARQGGKCAICDAESRLECHEVWEYDDTNHVQRLSGFVALCIPCHRVKHIGRTANLAEQGVLDLDEVLDHFMRVNECDFADLILYQEQLRSQYEARSKHEWTTDFGEYSELVQ